MKLTKEILLEAVTKSLTNAGQLIEEGKLLRAHTKFARAYTLFQLAIEEVGKASMTFGFLLFNNYENEEDQKKFLREFKDHKIKTEKAAGVDFMLAMTIGTSEVKKALIDNMQKQFANINKLNNVKNNSLYTSFIDNQVLMPVEVISEDIVHDLEFYAVIRHSASEQYYRIAVKEFEKMVEAKNKMDLNKLFNDTKEFIVDLYKEEQ